MLNGAGGSDDDPRVKAGTQPASPDVEVYGPKGLREYVRASLLSTHTHLDGWYVVHELHFPNDTPSDPALGVYEKEFSMGRDIAQGPEGVWGDFCEIDIRGGRAEFTVSAGEIKHSVPCIGYVLTEARLPGKIPPDYAKRIRQFKEELQATSGYKNPLEFLAALQNRDAPDDLNLALPDGTTLTKPPGVDGRKIVVLGDTCDPSGIFTLASRCDVLVHEATNAYLPSLDPSTKSGDTYQTVEERAKSRGHSTPEMAGKFAADIEMGKYGSRDALLVLNHFSSRYKDDEADGPDGPAMKIMEGIRNCAKDAWDTGAKSGGEEPGTWLVERRVVCARDGVKIEIKP